MPGGRLGAAIDWEACLAAPRLAGYAYPGASLAMRGQRLYLVGSESEVTYRGLDDAGRNLGMQATLRRRAGQRCQRLPVPAPRDLPFLRHVPPGLLRACLLPASLLGIEDLINWVPLRAANLAAWRLLERRLFEQVDPAAGRWAVLEAEPRYDFGIPVPSAVTWSVTPYEGEAAGHPWRCTLDNRLGGDHLSAALRRAWA